MGLASIANVPDDQNTTDEWAFSHMAHHRDIIRVLNEKHNIILPEYSLDPIDPNDFGLWGYQHQIMHNQMNAVLGIAGQDLVDVSWKDQEQRSVWIDLNFTEHLKANAILGV